MVHQRASAHDAANTVVHNECGSLRSAIAVGIKYTIFIGTTAPHSFLAWFIRFDAHWLCNAALDIISFLLHVMFICISH